MGGLQQSTLAERHRLPVADDHVVQHPHIDKRQGFFEARRQHLVRLTRLGDPGGMIMRQNNRGRIMIQCPLDDLAGVHGGTVYGAVEELLERQHAVSIVEKHAAEDLMLAVPKTRVQIVFGILGR